MLNKERTFPLHGCVWQFGGAMQLTRQGWHRNFHLSKQCTRPSLSLGPDLTKVQVLYNLEKTKIISECQDQWQGSSWLYQSFIAKCCKVKLHKKNVFSRKQLRRVLLKKNCHETLVNLDCDQKLPNLVFGRSMSPSAYDPNSKDTSNNHSFCFGTHWKSENVHQCSSPKHHNTITKTSPQHHHPSLRHQSITDTEQRNHQHKTKASPTYHQNITTQSLH